jgi:hypothetical protein
MSRMGGASRERFVELETSQLGPPSRGDSPHIMISPRTAAGLLTGSLALVILPVSESDGAIGPFDLTLYRVVPTLADFGKFQVFSAAAYRDQLILNDVSGGFGLFFSIIASGGDGRILIGVAEQA